MAIRLIVVALIVGCDLKDGKSARIRRDRDFMLELIASNSTILRASNKT